MELAPKRYYDQRRFPNTYYVNLMALEKILGTELFKGDSSRVFYSSPEYSLRRRLDVLNNNSSQDVHSLELPFMSYFRKGNWEVDRSRPAVENAPAALKNIGVTVENMNIRFMNTISRFEANCLFTRDDEAQIAHETLLWLKHPSKKQFIVPGLFYKSTQLDLPLQFQIDDISFNPTIKETDWLKKNRLFLLQFSFNIRSVIIAPIAQGSKSTLFETIEDPSDAFYITKEAYLDYFSSKNFPLPDEAYYEDVVIGSFDADPELTAIFTSQDITNTSIKLRWQFNKAALPNLEDTVKIISNTGIDIDVPLTNGEPTEGDGDDPPTNIYEITGLKPASTYEFTILFYSKLNYINRYSLIATTNSQDFKPIGLKPM